MTGTKFSNILMHALLFNEMVLYLPVNLHSWLQKVICNGMICQLKFRLQQLYSCLVVHAIVLELLE